MPWRRGPRPGVGNASGTSAEGTNRGRGVVLATVEPWSKKARELHAAGLPRLCAGELKVAPSILAADLAPWPPKWPRSKA